MFRHPPRLAVIRRLGGSPRLNAVTSDTSPTPRRTATCRAEVKANEENKTRPPHARPDRETSDMTSGARKEIKRDYGKPHNFVITKAIQAASTIDELLGIVKTSGHVFDKINVCALTVRSAKISFAAKGEWAGHLNSDIKSSNTNQQLVTLLSILEPLFIKNIKLFGSREISNIIWAFGKLGKEYVNLAILDLLVTRAKPLLPTIASLGINSANMVWALAKLGHDNDQEFFDLLADSIVDFLDSPSSDLPVSKSSNFNQVDKTSRASYNNQELTNILWAYCTLDRYKPRLWRAICIKVRPLISSFNGHDLASCLWSLASCGHIDNEVLTPLLSKIILQIHYLQTSEIGMISSCLPRLETSLASFPPQMTPEAKCKLLASCQGASKLLLREMRDRMMSSMQSDKVKPNGNNLSSYLDFGPQEVSSALWMVVVERGDQHDDQQRSHSADSLSDRELDEFLGWLMIAAGNFIDVFKPTDLSNLLWSCAKTPLAPPGLINRVLQALLPKMRGVQGTGYIAKIFWSLGRLGMKDSRHHLAFLAELTTVASPLLPSFGHQDLSNTLWALSMFRTAGHSQEHLSKSFLSSIIDCLKSHIRDSPSLCDQRELSSNAVSMARFYGFIYDGDMMEMIAGESVSRIHSLGGQEMGNLCWGFAKACHRNDSLMAAIGNKIIETRGKGLRTQEAANIACAFSSLGLSSEWREVYRYLGPSPSASFNTQDLANFSHAHAIASLYEPWLMDRLLRHVESKDDREWESQSFKMTLEMTQVLAYLLIVEEEGLLPHGSSEVTSDPRYVKLKRLATRAYQANAATGSFVQKEVFKALNTTSRVLDGRLEGKCFLEFLTSDNLFSIDIAVPSEMVAIEVDGPSHFLNSHPDSYEGTTLLRNRLLKNRGWKVVSFPVTQWKYEGKGTEMVAEESCIALGALIKDSMNGTNQGRMKTAPGQMATALAPASGVSVADANKTVAKRSWSARKIFASMKKTPRVDADVGTTAEEPDGSRIYLSEEHFEVASKWLSKKATKKAS